MGLNRRLLEGVDLDEELGPGQPCHADERVGGLMVSE
jgi:hypothetical protein